MMQLLLLDPATVDVRPVAPTEVFNLDDPALAPDQAMLARHGRIGCPQPIACIPADRQRLDANRKGLPLQRSGDSNQPWILLRRGTHAIVREPITTTSSLTMHTVCGSLGPLTQRREGNVCINPKVSESASPNVSQFACRSPSNQRPCNKSTG